MGAACRPSRWDCASGVPHAVACTGGQMTKRVIKVQVATRALYASYMLSVVVRAGDAPVNVNGLPFSLAL